jgi:hypothetical protein
MCSAVGTAGVSIDGMSSSKPMQAYLHRKHLHNDL